MQSEFINVLKSVSPEECKKILQFLVGYIDSNNADFRLGLRKAIEDYAITVTPITSNETKFSDGSPVDMYDDILEVCNGSYVDSAAIAKAIVTT